MMKINEIEVDPHKKLKKQTSAVIPNKERFNQVNSLE